MQKRLLLATFNLWVLCHAQTDFRFADSTAQWNVLNSVAWDCATSWCFIQKTLIHETGADTTIDNKSYQIINVPSSLWFGNYHLGEKVFLRKDSVDKVFLRRYNDSVDFLIYNFSKQAGDTLIISNPSLTPIFCNIDSVDTVLLDKPRKRFFVRYNEYWYPDIWIEGIGAIRSYFLQPGYDFTVADGPGYTTLCFFEKDSQIYHDAGFQSCSVDTSWLSVEAVPKNLIYISPNPATDYLTIQTENELSALTTFQLFDITGRMILQQPLTSTTTRIKLNGVSKGKYLYSVISDIERIGAGKIMVE